MRWPRFQGVPLAFVSQFDLADLDGVGAAAPLAGGGLLSFFFEATWAMAAVGPRPSWDVLHEPAGTRLERLSFPDDLDGYARYGTASVSAHTVPTFVSWESPQFRSLEFTPGEFEMYVAAEAAIDEEEDNQRRDLPDEDVGWLTFQLLGLPQRPLLDLQLECQYASHGLSLRDERFDEDFHDAMEEAAKDWRLLFQADSWGEIGMDWFGFGRLFFCIREDDLRARRFHRAAATSTD